MALAWKDRAPERVDRYLDWEVANWVAPTDRNGLPLGKRWCSVLVQVFPGPPGKPEKHLERLLTQIESPPSPAAPPIRVNADELHHLRRTIAAIKKGDPPSGDLKRDDVRLQFFVYLQEEDAYAGGRYVETDYYYIRLVGPPITTLKFHPAKSEFQTRLPAPSPMLLSRVAIGIIDDGIAFAHERFRASADDDVPGRQRTRFAALWLQDLETDAEDNSVAFGTRLEFNAIDAWFRRSAAATGEIDEAEVYRLAGVHDFAKDTHKSTALRAAHGTHVADIACGYDPRDEGAKGASVPIFAVQLPDAVTADTSGVNMGSYVLQALRQIMLWADRLDNEKPVPLVVNFSYGILAGPKDGTHYLEREIDRLVEHRNRTQPTAVVLPSGNAYRSRTTARFSLESGERGELDWILLPDDQTPSFLEIWFDEMPAADGEAPIDLELVPPLSGLPRRNTTPQSGQALVLEREEKPICGIYFDRPDGNAGTAPSSDCQRRSRLFVAVNPTHSLDEAVSLAPAGVWKIAVKNRSARKVAIDLFIQRDDTPAGYRRRGRQSFFDHLLAWERDSQSGDYDQLDPNRCPITGEGTLSAIGNGQGTASSGKANRVVMVGAAIEAEEMQPADYSSSGPTLTRLGPDFSAVAEDGHAFRGVLAAGSASGSVVALSGTSMAAPIVARKLVDLRADVDALKAVCRTPGDVDPRLGHCLIDSGTRRTPRRKHPSRAE